MKRLQIPRDRERGNAVTLTLLGLALAILAGVGVLYVVGKDAPRPLPVSVRESASTTEVVVDPRAGWGVYTDTLFQFSVSYPPGWLVASSTEDGFPVITVMPGTIATTSNEGEMSTSVSFYPRGSTRHAFKDVEYQSAVIVTIPEASAKDYVLTNKRPWATLVRFGRYPSSWDPNGYVFAEVAVEEEHVKYERGGVLLPDGTAPSDGDIPVRDGFVDPALRGLEEEMLRSIVFSSSSTTDTEASSTSPLTLESPKEDDLVSSPLTVRGAAPGSWYFEGSFPVKLETLAGEVVAEAPVHAVGEWMTSAMVPFEISLVFDMPHATSGRLVFAPDNPSGLSDTGHTFSIPVRFIEAQSP